MFALLIAILTSAGVVAGASSGGGGGGGSSDSLSELIVETGDTTLGSQRSTNPNDYKTSEYNAQYGLDSINAAEAYASLADDDLANAGKGVKIGIADSGVLLTHREININDSGLSEDLNDNVIDGDGYVTDTDGHGTHVASTAMGVKDGRGMHGVAYDAQVIGVAMGTSDSDGIAYAASQGATAINISWGYGIEEDYVEQNEIDSDWYEYLYVKMESELDTAIAANGGLGSVLVASAGNEGNDDYMSLPALFSQDAALEGIMISVVSVTGPNNIRADYSNACKQAKSFCIAAPGGSTAYPIYGAGIASNTSYINYSGTSMAAPHVTGAAAVIRAAWPTLTAAQTVQILLTTAEDIGDEGIDDVFGHGLLDLHAAVQPIGEEILSSGTSFSSADYDMSQTSIAIDPVFGDAFANNVSTQLESAVFFDDYGRDFKANLVNKMTQTSSHVLPRLDNIAFNNFQNTTIPLSLGRNDSSRFKFRVNTHKYSDESSRGLSKNYSKNRYGLKFLITDKSQEDDYVNASQGFSFAQDFSKNFQAGFSFNVNEAANVRGVNYHNAGSMTTNNFGDNPYQAFANGVSFSNQGMKRNYNQIFTSQKFLDNKFSANVMHQTSYETSSSFSSEISNRQNQMSDFNITYLPEHDSHFSVSFGNLDEYDNNLLNSKSLGAFEMAGDVKTSYFKIASTKKLAKNLYLISSFSEGKTKANGNNVGIFRDYSDIKSRSSSIGLINDDILGGKLGLVYSEPLRVYKGRVSVNVPVARDANGDIVRYAADVSLKPQGKEQDFELFYTKELKKDVKMNFNFVVQKEAGNMKDVNNNYLGFATYSKKF